MIKSMQKIGILKAWTTRRLLITLIGIGLALQAGLNNDVFGIFLGLYLASMGLLNMGCAGGACTVKSNNK
jgi:hypothetical protein